MKTRGSLVRAGLFVALVLLLSSVSASAGAGTHIAFGGGGFFPYSGDTGWDVHMQFMGGESARFGAEFEYRDFDNDLPKFFLIPQQGRLRTISVHFVFNYVFAPESPLRPYIGVAIGPMAVRIDSKNQPFTVLGQPVVLKTTGWGGGGSALGIVGLEVPLGTPNAAIYAEGRAGVEWLFYGSNAAGLDFGVVDQSISGIAAKGGLRFSF